MRESLYSEIANVHGLTNLPTDPDLAIAAGRALCENLLEPLQATFGRISFRSGYRSPEVNALGNTRYKSCAANPASRGRHIWDQPSADGGMGAMATIVIPWLLDQPDQSAGWPAMAWWIHDHLPYNELQFFPKLTAFNIGWHEFPRRRITSFAAPRGLLTKPGMPNHGGDHSAEYPGYPTLSSNLGHQSRCLRHGQHPPAFPPLNSHFRSRESDRSFMSRAPGWSGTREQARVR